MSNFSLWEHQISGAKALIKNKKYCLFFGVGTGKTITAKYALSFLPRHYKVLICAPKKVITHMWLQEKSFGLDDVFDIEYINYEKISRDKVFKDRKWDVIILDEVHRVKGLSSKVSKAIRAVSKKAEYVWGMTGTPVANTIVDVYAIYKNMSITEFHENYKQFIEKYFIFKPLPAPHGIFIPLIFGLDKVKGNELIARMGKHCMVKRTEDCVDLPEEVFRIVTTPFKPSEEYRLLAKGVLKEIDRMSTPQRLVAVNKYHQLANNFLYVDGVAVELSKRNGKYDFLKDYLHDHLEEAERTIIVYWFQRDLQDLLKLPFKVTTDPNKFKDNQILLMQFGQGEGLNLQYCNNMILYTYDYSYLKYEQIIGRIKRAGQMSNKITITVLINDNNIERKIWKAIKNKQSTDEFLKGALSERD